MALKTTAVKLAPALIDVLRRVAPGGPGKTGQRSEFIRAAIIEKLDRDHNIKLNLTGNGK